ncbi:protein YgfX [Paraglaciecola sp. 2405UD69-4]|uniref:protein YgfX n=1 Tax=Paraglaciecola sp. 2405UD69-4 TaxID=3391836 RepID=UPI0039C9B490
MFLLLALYLGFIVSIFTWQPNVIRGQLVLQSLCGLAIFILGAKSLSQIEKNSHAVVFFSERGEWLETKLGDQVSWQLTAKSRITGLALFIHMVSPLNSSESKWRLVFKDQAETRDFRRLCRAIIFQQQNSQNNV